MRKGPVRRLADRLYKEPTPHQMCRVPVHLRSPRSPVARLDYLFIFILSRRGVVPSLSLRSVAKTCCGASTSSTRRWKWADGRGSSRWTR